MGRKRASCEGFPRDSLTFFETRPVSSRLAESLLPPRMHSVVLLTSHDLSRSTGILRLCRKDCESSLKKSSTRELKSSPSSRYQPDKPVKRQ